MEETLEVQGKKVLEAAEQKLAAIDNPSHTFMKFGFASQLILEHAAEHQCDLIVIGSRGLSGIREFLGSVSHSVVQQSSVPVFIVK